MRFDTQKQTPAPPPEAAGAGPVEETFGTELRRLREAAGLAMEQLAEASGVSARAISDMERGHTRSPHRRSVTMLVRALHLNSRDGERLQILARPRSQASTSVRHGSGRRTDLLGRGPELGALETALHAAQRLRGSALVLRGGPGLGKTALLHEALAQGAALALTVLSVTAVPAETHLPFTGLRQLLEPLLGGDEPTTRTARHLVLRASAEGPLSERLEPYQVATAALDLVIRGPRRPARLLLVDDAQWLDRPSWDTIAFLARRIATQPVAMIITMRDSTETDLRLASAGLAELRVHPLDPDASGALIDRTAPHLPTDLRARVLAQAAGHPLALIDLSAALADPNPGPEADNTLPLSDRLQRSYTTALDALPDPTPLVLRVAALHDSDSTTEILAAVRTITGRKATRDDLRPALDAQLLTGTAQRTVFRHPLIREAVRQSTPAHLIEPIHLALAQAVGPLTDRGVRHRAAGTQGPDEELARALASLAGGLGDRGALADAADAWELAAERTADQEQRAVFGYRASLVIRALGDSARYQRLAAGIDPARLPVAVRSSFLKGREDALQAGWTPGTDLAGLADDVRRLHAQGKTETAAYALGAVSLRCFWTPPDPASRAALIDVFEGLGLAPLDGRLLHARAHIAPIERGRAALETITAILRGPYTSDPGLTSLGFPASAVGAHPQARTFLSADIARYRAQRAVGGLAESLVSQAFVCAQLGEVTSALSSSREAQLLSDQVGRPFWVLVGRLCEAQAEALGGNTAVALNLAEQVEHSLLAYGAHPHLSLVQLVRGIAHLTQGRPTDAFDALARILDPNDPAHHLYTGLAAMPHLAEAGATSPERRHDLRTLIHDTRATAEMCGWPPLLIGLAQADARLAPDGQADDAYAAALKAIPATWAFERARTQLAYGSWLRRHNQTSRARPHLQAAWHTFQALSTSPWAQRARTELRATGTRTHQTGPDTQETTGQLTAQELQIARLAASGLTNRQIAENLALSPRTVSTHLYRTYPKLGITSRHQLTRTLPAAEPDVRQPTDPPQHNTTQRPARIEAREEVLDGAGALTPERKAALDDDDPT